MASLFKLRIFSEPGMPVGRVPLSWMVLRLPSAGTAASLTQRSLIYWFVNL